MKYAVLGTGMVGHTLASKLVTLGHSVRMGARTADNEKASAWAAANGDQGGQGSFEEVATWANRIVVAISGARIVQMAQSVAADAVADKTVIDVTNPLDFSKGMPPFLVPELSNTTSAAEALQAAWPGAKVVKTLNTMNHEIMVEPARVAGAHDVFLSGDHADAKADAVSLLEQFGWSDPIDLGPLSAARGMEGMMPFWLSMWSAVGNANFNYRIVRG